MVASSRLTLAAVCLALTGCGVGAVLTPPLPLGSTSTMNPLAPILPASESLVTVDRIAAFPPPGWHVPRMIRMAPDGSLVTYLKSETGGSDMALFAFDPKTREHRVLLRARELVDEGRAMTREEELRRERQRTQIHGVTSYAWASNAMTMLVPIGDRVFVRRADGTSTALAGDGIVDPKLSPDGTRIAFARGRELWLAEVGGAERAITQGAPEGVTRGQSDFNMQEEFDEPSGLFWSPTSDRVAFLEVDERQVAEIPILGYRGAPDLQALRYPRAGATNPSVRLGVATVGGQVRWLDLALPAPFEGASGYLGRLSWSPDGQSLYLQRLTRDQRHLALVKLDVATGAARVLARHDDASWTSMTEHVPLADGRVLAVWPHEGRRHLALIDGERGGLLRQATQGEFDVFHLVGVDRRGRALAIANRDAPLERALYAVDLVTGSVLRTTPEPGVHVIESGHVEHGYVDVHSSHNRPPRVTIHDADGAPIGAIDLPEDPDVARLGLRSPELVTVPARGDAPRLHGALLKPRRLEPGVRYPALVVVYGGPGVQSVLDDYNPRLLWQHLADRGIVVLQVDNRGASGHGHGFESPIAGRLGERELEDQLRALEWLEGQPFVDASRVGVYGHSYGGYMALSAMLRAPGRFKVGIAGSPVTDWSLYDTGYTERYMGTPASNPSGYLETSLVPVAHNLRGKLLIVHALMDENVHFEHTARLIDAFVRADKDFDLMVFPGERHGYRSSEARRYAYRRVIDYLVSHL
ncbi:MAG: S9 family peptidase [Deltaproteobacteria bacterium]|nr:S9 family peptidase [Deltaproteobacteria bacterium]